MFIIIAGAPGTGKSWYIKEMLRKWGIDEGQVLAMDINHEYNTPYRFYDHNQLIEVSSKLKNKVILFEEATSFFSFANSKKVKSYFTTHRHKNHTIFANFHSLASIPADLLMAVDYLYYTETLEKRPPDWVKGLDTYTLYTRAELIPLIQ